MEFEIRNISLENTLFEHLIKIGNHGEILMVENVIKFAQFFLRRLSS